MTKTTIPPNGVVAHTDFEPTIDFRPVYMHKKMPDADEPKIEAGHEGAVFKRRSQWARKKRLQGRFHVSSKKQNSTSLHIK